MSNWFFHRLTFAEFWTSIPTDNQTGGKKMSVRTDIPFVEIAFTKFQTFDRGELITQVLPEEWNLRQGDSLHWTCAQYGGIARVVNCSLAEDNNTSCVLEKVS
jgi:hypothetical protein